MNGRQAAQYFIVRYMYNELGDEAANIGVIVVGQHPKEFTYQFLDELKAKDRADRQINQAAVTDFRAWLEHEAIEVRRHDSGTWQPAFEQRLREKTGNIIRVLGPRTVLTNDLYAEVRALYDDWVAPRRSPPRLIDRARSSTTRP